MSHTLATTAIDGVLLVHLRAHADERGRFMETFRLEWFPQVSWARLQSNRSDSRAGVLRGLHYHFHQADYWVVPAGRIRAGLADLRPSSPTYRQALTVDMGEEHLVGLFIPPGVAHGFYALTDCTLFYTVNNYYDGSDEYGVAWDDPQLAVPWGVSGAPLLSPRDAANSPLAAIPPERLPD
jgi:dTDP-4-dehydrorhamnose 3,5-epimerase